MIEKDSVEMNLPRHSSHSHHAIVVEEHALLVELVSIGWLKIK